MATSRENKVTTRHRNDRGAGTVFYNDKLNRWIVMVPMPKTFDGKRKRLKRSFKTKSEAIKRECYIKKNRMFRNKIKNKKK